MDLISISLSIALHKLTRDKASSAGITTLFVLMFDLAFEPCHEIYYTRRCSKSQAGVFGCRCCTARLQLLDCMADDSSLNPITTGLSMAFMLTTWTNLTKDSTLKRSSSRLATAELERRTHLFRDGREQTEARPTDLELSSCRGTRDWTGGWKKWLVFVTRVTLQPIDGSIFRTAFTAATCR